MKITEENETEMEWAWGWWLADKDYIKWLNGRQKDNSQFELFEELNK